MIVDINSPHRSQFNIDGNSTSSEIADEEFIKYINEKGSEEEKKYYADWKSPSKTIDEPNTYAKRNPNKELIMTMEGSMLVDNIDNFPDWRDMENNGVCQVNKRVGLFLKDMKFNPKLDLNLGDSKDFLDTFRGIVNKADKMKQNFEVLTTLGTDMFKHKNNSMQTLIRRISKLHSFNPHDVKAFFDSLTFKVEFTFGQFGLFNAYEEVVKPICALMGVIAPKKGTFDNKGVNYYMIPYPTENQFIGLQASGIAKNMTSGAISTIKKTMTDSVKSNFSQGSQAAKEGNGGAVKNAVESTLAVLNEGGAMLENILYSGTRYIIEQKTGYGEKEYRFANFRYGTIKVGPCMINEVKGSFDHTKIDENGYPYRGTVDISVSDLKTATSDGLLKMFHSYES